MPFGAEVLPGRGVRFQLWAPQAARVELCLDGHPPLPMERDPEGWARLVTDRARPGAPYRNGVVVTAPCEPNLLLHRGRDSPSIRGDLISSVWNSPLAPTVVPVRNRPIIEIDRSQLDADELSGRAVSDNPVRPLLSPNHIEHPLSR